MDGQDQDGQDIRMARIKGWPGFDACKLRFYVGAFDVVFYLKDWAP